MPIEQLVKRKIRTALSALLLLAAVALVLTMPLLTPQANGAPVAGPDLTVEISLDPAAPGVNEQVTVNVVARNIGTSNATSQVRVHLYIDPPDRPPTSATTGFPLIQVPGLNAGASTTGSRTHTFTTPGCDHVIYAWIDRDNAIAEDNENNNLIALPLCIDVECQVDGYEQDNMCSVAGWITENAAQARSFCDATDPALADEDWIKFTAFAGVTYTLGTSNAGIHADPQLTLYNACDATAQTSPSAGQVTWNAPASSVYYVKLARDADTQGPLTAYSLTLSSATGITDDYEPDTSCATARDITTDGVRQTHLFQAPGDEDWIKFSIKGGENFIVVTDNTATGVIPLITLYNSCEQVPGQNYLGQSQHQLQHSAITDQVFYARLANTTTNVFGANAKYDLAVTASDCLADSLEPDNTAAQATLLATNGISQTHDFCPVADDDWVKFEVQTGKTYVLQTTSLGLDADTVLHLYDTNGTSELATNDDYGYVKASRIVWQPAANGVYLARVHHQNPGATGARTKYAIALHEGYCNLDLAEGNNGPGEALAVPTDGTASTYNFCADPLDTTFGDQDWISFQATAGGTYEVHTSDLSANTDTVLELFDRDGATVLLKADDGGAGRASSLVLTPTVSGTYFVRALQYNSNINGSDTQYNLAIFGTEPPTPTPTPTPSPSPTPTPTPLPTVEPSQVKTLILTNRQQMEAIHGVAQTNALIEKLFDLADHPRVNGAVIMVESDPAVAAAYTSWTANEEALLNVDQANAVAGAIRNQVLAFLDSAPNARYLVVVGDDRIVPFRRVLDRVPQGTSGGGSTSSGTIEEQYATDVTTRTVTAAALAANMILTDDYYADRVPSQWTDKQNNQYEVYVPDYATSRLVETPTEIMAFIDTFLSNQVINSQRALVTGYDFVADSADVIGNILSSDVATTDKTLIGGTWLRDDMVSRHLNPTQRFDLQSLNGHSTHVSTLVPKDPLGTAQAPILASEVAAATGDLAGTLIFNVGCHGGLNDTGVLDLPQAFMQKRANYVGNTGYGWGGGGTVLSEDLMRNYTISLLTGTVNEIGPALQAAKQSYFSSHAFFNAYDAKVLMQVVLYGLPMFEIQSTGSFDPSDPFPSANETFIPPSSFGDIYVGKLSYGLPGSFGAFGETNTGDGQVFDLDDSLQFGAGDPVQPRFYRDVSAPSAGDLRGAVFTGGVYSDVVNFNPVVALPFNEYVSDTTEPAFSAEGWYPATPFALQNSISLSDTTGTVVMALGQFTSTAGIERIYSQLSFDVFYSDNPDLALPTISFVDGILNQAAGTGTIKVETRDASGIQRVVIAFTNGQGQWASQDLAFSAATQKWTGVITGTVNTRFFVQAVDQAGNVTVENNKGRYLPLSVPLPLIQGAQLGSRIYLPVISKN